MELIPKEKQPVTGTEGAYYRRHQLMHQLPIYDQDPSRCRGLLENELKLMEEFVKQYKSEALGVGEVALPGQGGLPKEEGKQQEKPEGTEPTAPTTNGSIGDPTKEYVSLSQAPGAAAATGQASSLIPALIHAARPPAAIGAHSLCAWHHAMDNNTRSLPSGASLPSGHGQPDCGSLGKGHYACLVKVGVG